MRYRCRLSDIAEADLVRLPTPIRSYLVKHLRRLEKNPSALSIPSHFPYPEKCQLFHLPIYTHNATRHHLIVLFRYGQDEETLLIVGIGHSILSD